MAKQFDIAIIGGGLAGASLANMLAGSALRVAVVEAHSAKSDQHPGYDDRSVALAYGSRILFENCGLWADIKNDATAIQQIHISEQGRFGVTQLDASEEMVEALGYVIETRDLGSRLYSRLNQASNIELFCPAELQRFSVESDQVNIEIKTEQVGEVSLSAKLLVAADGFQSKVRESAGIEVESSDYGQTAIICNVTPDQAQQHIAYERFTRSGPLAFLPLKDYVTADGKRMSRYSVVFTVKTDEVDAIMALTDEDFLQELQQRIGFRLGKLVQTGRRVAYPLSLVHARQSIAQRVALVGNAVHTLHPVAGQGFNLGLRDVAVLAEQVLLAHSKQDDPGSAALLEFYQQTRARDHQAVIKFTDTLAKAFTWQFPPAPLVRSLGLGLADTVPGLKSFLARRAMGIVAGVPRFRV